MNPPIRIGSFTAGGHVSVGHGSRQTNNQPRADEAERESPMGAKKIRAKFMVQEIAECFGGRRLTASVVYGGSEENDRYFEATPSGSLELTTLRGDVLEGFKPGTQFHVDITLAEPE